MSSRPMSVHLGLPYSRPLSMRLGLPYERCGTLCSSDRVPPTKKNVISRFADSAIVTCSEIQRSAEPRLNTQMQAKSAMPSWN